ncbi:hypothetical protein GCM10027168_58380 [Streptomyces capparidis]
MDCERARVELAARELGGGDFEDAVAEHLETCPDCRAEGEADAAAAAMLSAVEAFELDGVPVPDPERAIARLRRTERPPGRAVGPSPATRAARGYRRSLFVLAAVFAGAVLAGGGAVAAARRPPAASPPRRG